MRSPPLTLLWLVTLLQYVLLVSGQEEGLMNCESQLAADSGVCWGWPWEPDVTSALWNSGQKQIMGSKNSEPGSPFPPSCFPPGRLPWLTTVALLWGCKTGSFLFTSSRCTCRFWAGALPCSKCCVPLTFSAHGSWGILPCPGRVWERGDLKQIVTQMKKNYKLICPGR